MNLIQKIKEFFKIDKTKKLVSANESNNTIEVKKENIIDELSKETKEVSLDTNEKIKEILKTAGCNKEIFRRVESFENINIQNLKSVLSLLTGMSLTKYQLNVILGQNIDVLNTDAKKIENNINLLKEYIADKECVKNIVYTNPFVLTKNIELNINILKEKMDNISLDNNEQISIIDENSNILTMDTERLILSFDVINKFFNNNESVKEGILNDPFIIGIIDEKVLKENI